MIENRPIIMTKEGSSDPDDDFPLRLHIFLRTKNIVKDYNFPDIRDFVKAHIIPSGIFIESKRINIQLINRFDTHLFINKFIYFFSIEQDPKNIFINNFISKKDYELIFNLINNFEEKLISYKELLKDFGIDNVNNYSNDYINEIILEVILTCIFNDLSLLKNSIKNLKLAFYIDLNSPIKLNNTCNIIDSQLRLINRIKIVLLRGDLDNSNLDFLNI